MGGISGKFLKEFLEFFEELLAHAYTEHYQNYTVYLAVCGLCNVVILLSCLLYCTATTIHMYMYMYITVEVRS